MGVPKFFRWLSERYPKINQRAGFPPSEETCLRHFNQLPPAPLIPPDELSQCGLPPPIDRLYIDMNGILHGCSHNNNSDSVVITQDEIFQNVGYYLDRIVSDIVKPSELLYLSIDGVAPRAKLNQQRSRRYRSGNEGEIEETIYEAHLQQNKRDASEKQENDDDGMGIPGFEEYTMTPHSSESLQEVEPGRFTGKFESHAVELEQRDGDASNRFHHNEITPGTPFFQDCTDFLHKYIKNKMETDDKWKHLTIILSGPDVPGEGEHKIMDFIRREKTRPDYNVNTKHCIMGQDGDWIMLGLATHEPNLLLLREQVVFEAKKQAILEKNGIASYIHNSNFEYLHLSILRDYLAYEFETKEVVFSSKYLLEETIDDFVFLTFFVGNDFLPHMPALDIADEAFELLFHIYRKQRKSWQRSKKLHPYLTHAGTIVSGKRLEKFVAHLGQHELPYYDNKKRSQATVYEQVRKSDTKHGREPTIPDDEILELKEEADRAKYREMLQSLQVTPELQGEFSPVLSKAEDAAAAITFQPSSRDDEEEELEEGLVARMSNLLQFSVKGGDSDADTTDSSGFAVAAIDDQDLKGRYYYDKFVFTPFDAEKHTALRKAYIEGLVWNLKYYYQGCVSWEWYFPYHYGPMMSDLVGIDEMLEEIQFDDLGEPLTPFEQLMGCMPPSCAHLLPEPYRWLLTEPSSPLADFYPRTFTVDMNGKRWPWEAVVLLPFIDSGRLIHAARNLVREDLLTDEEKKRNKKGNAWVITKEVDSEMTNAVPLESTDWDYQPEETAVLKPELMAGVQHPRPGFPTLKEAPIRSLWRRNVGINVFGLRSRYRTALLVLGEVLPTTPPVQSLGKKLIGTTIFINYPQLIEAFVTAISDSEFTMRGTDDDNLRPWDANESLFFRQKSSAINKGLAFGEKLTGSGGWMMPEHDIVVTARPLKGLKTLADGSKARVFAKFEVDVPLTAAIWAPSYEDPRLANIPALLEKDPYSVAVKEKKEEASAPLLPEVEPSPLLPDYEEIDSDSEGEAPLGPILPHFPESDPYAPPLILPAFEDQDPPVMHPPHEKPKAKQKRKPRRKKPMRKKSATALASTSNDDSRDMAVSLLPPTDDITAMASRGFATSARGLRHSNLTSGKRSFSTARTLSTRVANGSPRVRLFALGAAAAAVFMNGNSANALYEPFPSPLSFGLVPSLVFDICGGGQVFENEQDDNDSSARNFLNDVKPPPLEFAHGTTTLSFTFDGGIVAAVDSRASIGNFVGSKTTQKVLPIHSHLLGTMAGGAADCSFWIRKMQAEAQLYELQEGKHMSVGRASKILATALFENRALKLSIGTMIMGFDETHGPQIYYVDNSGARIHGDLFAVGSGSTFAYAILDTERRKEMTQDEAIALGIKAIRYATFRDAFSGGFINVYVINKDGWRKVFSEDIAQSPPREDVDADVVNGSRGRD